MGTVPNSKNVSFKAGSSVQKNAIKKTANLRASSLSKNSNTKKDGSTNGEQNGSGDFAQTQNQQARDFAQTRPGSSAKAAKKAVDYTKSKSQEILNISTTDRDAGGLVAPGRAYNDINSTQQAASDSAAWQAQLKGGADLAKTIQEGAKVFGQAFAAFAPLMTKGGGGQQNG